MGEGQGHTSPTPNGINNNAVISNGHQQPPLTEVTVIECKSEPTPPTTTPGLKNATLERESFGCKGLVFYSSVFITLDVLNQVITYGMKYLNDNSYPVPQTSLVFVIESLKFLCYVLLIWWTKGIQGFKEVKVSLWYSAPSICYAINNNIYFYALNYTTPPVWNILGQLRLVFTAVTYRLFFKRTLTWSQWAGLTFLMGAVALTNFTGVETLLNEGGKVMFLFVLASICASVAVIGNLSTEYFFKNDSRTFNEMQLQIYGFGSLATGFLFILESSATHQATIKGDLNVEYALVAACVLLGSAVGISIAFIIKKLDNIVKIYTQSLSNMLTSLACTFFFPDHFFVNFKFLGCLVLICIGITLYESKEIAWKKVIERFKTWLPA